jgi:large subunit ribosomal protein L30
MSKIAVVRIRGEVGLRGDFAETFVRMRLGKKYSCVILEPTKENLGMIQKVKDLVAFGEISDEMYKKLVEKRQKNVKDFFRLNPPRGGIKSKLHFPRGVLGNHGKEINKLIERML